MIVTSSDKGKVDKTRCDGIDALKALKKNIIIRAVLCVATIALTLVLLFSLTLAWSTNVVHTGGLSFKAEKWSFSGDITVFEGLHEIAPGDVGKVSMRLANDGESVVAAGVTVSKRQMSEAMQKRIYFYVEDGAVRNGELTQRVYVSNTGGYTYTIFPHSELIVNEQEQNVPALCFEWVYDVLGYYVSGTYDGEQVVVNDYIRPVVYDFDVTSTTFDVNGRLETLDGYKGVREFISELSVNDGYLGEINYDGVTADGYYPVSVDINGKGIWLYLCNYYEIIENMEADTIMGSDPDGVTCRAVINVTGQNVNEEDIVVDGEEDLIQALMDPTGAIIRLSRDIVLEEPLSLAQNKAAMIYLCGHTIVSNADTIVEVGTNAILNILDGELRGGGTTNAAVKLSGADVTLSGVVISNVNEGVMIEDNKNNIGADSKVHLVGCNISAKEDGIILYGNGDGSATNTSLIINNCTIVGDGYSGLICNGAYFGTSIEIIDSRIGGYYTAIYHPQKDSEMNIRNSVLTGWTGIAVKGGTVNIDGSMISGTGELREPAYDSSGWTDTGDGVYLEANYDCNTRIAISGDCIVTSTHGEAVRQFEDDKENAEIVISGGYYSSDISRYLADGYAVTESDGGFVVSADLSE